MTDLSSTLIESPFSFATKNRIVYNPDNRTEVDNFYTTPWNGIGVVKAAVLGPVSGTINSYSTGALLDSRHVLTAAHGLYFGNSKWVAPSGLCFYPGVGTFGTNPPSVNGVYYASEFFLPGVFDGNLPATEKINSFRYDYAIIKLKDPVPNSVMTYSIVNLSDDQIRAASFSMTGYSGDKWPNENTPVMTKDVGKADQFSDHLIYPHVSITSGGSGSPLMHQKNTISGMMVGGERYGNANIALRITDDVLAQIQVWMKE
ncbi:trypsin-like serine protease (plasmid) [Serratia sp. PAMC26656]|uniref:trypsin-like serine peptidase n=1 Tax=Serratia sp. PAMC26656 TaxID=2775909 RepID=UPI0018F32507|nr:trypsin-like serine protease [Serratia sp. PAMC26656]MBJ7889484.1 trypsin-like serine protease [Serratia sp. PAMC26656]